MESGTAGLSELENMSMPKFGRGLQIWEAANDVVSADIAKLFTQNGCFCKREVIHFCQVKAESNFCTALELFRIEVLEHRFAGSCENA